MSNNAKDPKASAGFPGYIATNSVVYLDGQPVKGVDQLLRVPPFRALLFIPEPVLESLHHFRAYYK
jgi:hypothetical protein